MRAYGGKSNLRDARERLVFFAGLLKKREEKEREDGRCGQSWSQGQRVGKQGKRRAVVAVAT